VLAFATIVLTTMVAIVPLVTLLLTLAATILLTLVSLVIVQVRIFGGV
jgi:hypothetical protein